MEEFRRCILLLLNVVVGLLSVSGTSIPVKYVCPDDSVQAFQNIDFDRCNALVSLNINGKRNTLIATWSFQNCNVNATIVQDYQDRVFLDQNGTITIHNFHHFDQGKYIVISKTDTYPSIQEVEIHLMNAPTLDCNPIIHRVGNKLIATLKSKDCGQPVATPYWKGYDGVSDTHDPILQITPGNEDRTYTSCIAGLALQCSKSLTQLDYCSPFVVKGSGQAMPSESCSTVVSIAVIIVLAVFLILAIVVIVILILKRRRVRGNISGEQTVRLLDVHSGENLLETINPEHTASVPGMEQLWKKHFDTLKWEDINKLLNHDQQQGLQTYCNSLGSPNYTRVCVETHHDCDHQMNGTGTEHQANNDPEEIRELQELRDAALCKICFANKMSVFFMPCNHIATCADCSVSLQNCPVCRAAIEEKTKIIFDLVSDETQ